MYIVKLSLKYRLEEILKSVDTIMDQEFKYVREQKYEKFTKKWESLSEFLRKKASTYVKLREIHEKNINDYYKMVYKFQESKIDYGNLQEGYQILNENNSSYPFRWLRYTPLVLVSQTNTQSSTWIATQTN